MTAAHSYTPDPGSMPARVLALFVRTPDEEYTSGDLALKFDTSSSNMAGHLAEPVRHGLLVHAKPAGETVKVWQAGPKFAAWAAGSPSSAAGAATATGAPSAPSAPAKGRRGGTRAQLPPLDAKQMVTELNVAPPPIQRFSKAGVSKYDAVFAGLPVNACRRVPAQYHATLVTAVKKRHKTLPERYLVRRISPTETGVYRTA